jgi:restriction system protein
MADTEVPAYHELLWPTLQSVSQLGGSASISEIVEAVTAHERFTDDQQAVLHNDGPQTEVGYRLAWARTHLKGMGLLTNSERGVWALTDEGTALLTDPGLNAEGRRDRVRQAWTAYVVELRNARRTRQPEPGPQDSPQEATATRGWKEQLLEVLMAIPPDRFERLARRLLREADFDSVQVTGRSGDGGIDGMGVYRLGLVSFPVFFQCKRYRGSVGAGAVRDFRGAMAGGATRALSSPPAPSPPTRRGRRLATASRPST